VVVAVVCTAVALLERVVLVVVVLVLVVPQRLEPLTRDRVEAGQVIAHLAAVVVLVS